MIFRKQIEISDPYDIILILKKLNKKDGPANVTRTTENIVRLITKK